jgi:hypothetical protein
MPPITEPAMVALSPMLRPADPELGSGKLDVPWGVGLEVVVGVFGEGAEVVVGVFGEGIDVVVGVFGEGFEVVVGALGEGWEELWWRV